MWQSQLNPQRPPIDENPPNDPPPIEEEPEIISYTFPEGGVLPAGAEVVFNVFLYAQEGTLELNITVFDNHQGVTVALNYSLEKPLNDSLNRPLALVVIIPFKSYSVGQHEITIIASTTMSSDEHIVIIEVEVV